MAFLFWSSARKGNKNPTTKIQNLINSATRLVGNGISRVRQVNNETWDYVARMDQRVPQGCLGLQSLVPWGSGAIRTGSFKTRKKIKLLKSFFLKKILGLRHCFGRVPHALEPEPPVRNGERVTAFKEVCVTGVLSNDSKVLPLLHNGCHSSRPAAQQPSPCCSHLCPGRGCLSKAAAGGATGVSP